MFRFLAKRAAGIGITLLIATFLVFAVNEYSAGNVARKILGPEKIIGLSTDTFAELEEANAWDVDYVAVQAYDTQTKADAARPLGPEGMRKARSLTRHPLVAIGGIHLSNAADISAAGADSVAVVSEIMSAKDPEKASADLMAAINSGIARR